MSVELKKDTIISHYKILEKIGAGGMGIVYKAQDTKLDRIVALKFLSKQFSVNEEEKKRFIHEAKAAAALDHTNICSIYEIDETEDGQMFMAIGYYEGKTIKDRIECRGEVTSPLPMDESINIAIQIVEGLQEAHEKKIIHRDIKSANIIITDKGIAKILDFGLAKLKGVTKLTKEGTTLGTVSYMSPEQARGEEADSRSDIWSLGVVLYEMVTGQVPFKGEYEQATMYAIMNEDPEPVTSLRTGVSKELERIIHKTLIKDSKERYQHTEDLLVDLKNLQKHPVANEIKHPHDSPVSKKTRSLKEWFPLLAGLFMVLVVAGYFIVKGPQQPEDPQIPKPSKKPSAVGNQWKNSIAVLPFSNISPDKEQEYFCAGMTEEIITKLTTINDLKVISRTTVMRFKNSKKTIKEIGRQLAVENVLEGSVRRDNNRIRITAQLIRVADDAHLWAKSYDRKLEDIFAVQDEVSQAIANSLKVTISPGVLDQFKSGETQNMQAYEFYLQGMFIMNSQYLKTLAEEDFQQAVQMLKKALELDPTFVNAYSELVWIYGNHLIFSGNQADFEEIEKFSKKLEEIGSDSAYWHFSLGTYYMLKRDLDRAFSHYNSALKKMPNNAKIIYVNGWSYRRAGLERKALRYCDKAMDLDPLLPHAYATAIRCSMYLKDYLRTESYIKRAETFFKDQPLLMRIIFRFNLRIGRYDQAEEYLGKLRKANWDHKDINTYKAFLHALRGERDQALKLNPTSSEVLAILDLKDQAIAIMQKALKSDKDEYKYLYLINQPFYDNLRGDPRFQNMVSRAKEIYEERLCKYGDY